MNLFSGTSRAAIFEGNKKFPGPSRNKTVAHNFIIFLRQFRERELVAQRHAARLSVEVITLCHRVGRNA